MDRPSSSISGASIPFPGKSTLPGRHHFMWPVSDSWTPHGSYFAHQRTAIAVQRPRSPHTVARLTTVSGTCLIDTGGVRIRFSHGSAESPSARSDRHRLQPRHLPWILMDSQCWGSGGRMKAHSRIAFGAHAACLWRELSARVRPPPRCSCRAEARPASSGRPR